MSLRSSGLAIKKHYWANPVLLLCPENTEENFPPAVLNTGSEQLRAVQVAHTRMATLGKQCLKNELPSLQ